MLIHKNILPIIKATPKNDPRKALMGIHVCRENGVPTAVATDGHIGVKVQWTDTPKEDLPKELAAMQGEKRSDLSLIIPKAHWSNLKSMMASDKEFPWSDSVALNEHPEGNPEGMMRFQSLGFGSEHEALVKPIEGQYPSFDSVIPKYDVVPQANSGNAAVQVTITTELLVKMAQALDSLGCKVVTMQVPLTRLSPIRFDYQDADSGTTVLGILMPYKTSDDKPVENEDDEMEDYPPDVPDMFEEE